MYDKIAVISDKDNQTVPLEASNKTLLYLETDGRWRLDREIGWRPSQETGWPEGVSARLEGTAPSDTEPGNAALGIPEIRGRIRTLIEELGDCRIIVSRKMTGIPYHIFDKTGFHIFETADPPSQDLFRGIIREIEEAEAKALASHASAAAQAPVSPNRDGNYYLNLIELQRAHPEISSKKALRQFMEEAEFSRLELICNHMPPWMEGVIASKNYECRIETIDGQACKVTVSNPRDFTI